LQVKHERLHNFIEEALPLYGDHIYLKTSGASYTYKQIFELAGNFEDVFFSEGIDKKERIVIYSSKNAASIAVMAACSKLNCIYVPISSMNPAIRAIQIIEDTTAKFVVCDDACKDELIKSGLQLKHIQTLNDVLIYSYSTPRSNKLQVNKDTAFILYTSGSTGSPKGVSISHQAAIVFIIWAAKEFQINHKDLLTSIAPFNFDLSVFDIYVSAYTGATLLLYTENETKNAMMMAMKLSEDKATTIYATPTFYSTLAFYGKLHKYDYSHLTNVLFAGEVFLPENFNKLFGFWGRKKYFNLYGPTETNVCTFYKVNTDNNLSTDFPIGKICDYAGAILIDAKGTEVTKINEKGELLITGNSLFDEYWNDNDKTFGSLYKNSDGLTYYKTGDIAYKSKDGNFVYVGRKDRMIKKNGFRIEPSEVENVIVSFQNISIASVIFDDISNTLICYIESTDSEDIEIQKIRESCLKHLPQYMVPDKFVTLKTMPRTSSGKIDLQALNEIEDEL
jgi:L-proline---[L-prolyl-carrier protein] ligase